VKSKKRYVIAFWIAATMVVALGIGMVAVLASFQGTASSGFNISYTAINVNAKVTAEYKLGSAGSGSYGTTAKSITFTASESGTGANHALTKTIDTFNVTMAKNKDLIIHYSIQNTASTTDSANEKFTITATDNFKSLAESNNLTVEYCSTESTTANSWKSTLAELNLSEVADGATVNFYVKVSITDPTKTVNVTNANFSFLLAVA